MVGLQILEHPNSMDCDYYAPVSLTVLAIGPGPLLYRWKRDEVDVVDEDCIGVDKPTLTIRSFSSRHEGTYMCEVANNQMSIKSNPSKLQLSKYFLYEPN